jgi:hypothetical protein
MSSVAELHMFKHIKRAHTKNKRFDYVALIGAAIACSPCILRTHQSADSLVADVVALLDTLLQPRGQLALPSKATAAIEEASTAVAGTQSAAPYAGQLSVMLVVRAHACLLLRLYLCCAAGRDNSIIGHHHTLLQA